MCCGPYHKTKHFEESPGEMNYTEIFQGENVSTGCQQEHGNRIPSPERHTKKIKQSIKQTNKKIKQATGLEKTFLL